MRQLFTEMFEIIPAPVEDLLIMMFVIFVFMETFLILLAVDSWRQKDKKLHE